MRRSFGLRLAAAFGGVGIAAASVTAILVNFAFGSRFTGYLEQQREARQAQIVAALADSYNRMGGWVQEDLDTLGPIVLMDGGTLHLLDPSGRAVWIPQETAFGTHMADMHRQMMGTGPLGPQHRIPIPVDGRVVGTAVVRLPEAGLLPQDVSFRTSVNRLLLLGGIVAGAAALLLGVFLARRAIAPTRLLTDASRALAAGDRSHRVRVGSDDEFGEMAESFNRMADTIEEEERLRRAFAADVAHELRTPLAILRSEVEALQDGVTHVTTATLASLHEEILRLSRLVADLQTMASADAAGFSLERKPLPLQPLIQESANEFAGLFEARRIRLSLSLVDVTAEVDATRVRQIVANLLSNAMKFTPARGSVELRLSGDGPWAVLAVADTGIGIPPDELSHVFDRFYRGKDARAGGSGIGLSVVRELVGAHGGSVDVTSEPGKGSTFTVRLPRASSGAHTAFALSSQEPSTVASSSKGVS